MQALLFIMGGALATTFSGQRHLMAFGWILWGAAALMMYAKYIS